MPPVLTSGSFPQVMDMLHRLYNKFDALTAHYDLFKVETIGDAVSRATTPQEA
jgi:hypothetical protein